MPFLCLPPSTGVKTGHLVSLPLLPSLSCASCCQTSNQTGKLNQIRCKIKKERQKEVWKGEGEPKRATIYCCPPKSPRSGVTFHFKAKPFFVSLYLSNKLFFGPRHRGLGEECTTFFRKDARSSPAANSTKKSPSH